MQHSSVVHGSVAHVMDVGSGAIEFATPLQSNAAVHVGSTVQHSVVVHGSVAHVMDVGSAAIEFATPLQSNAAVHVGAAVQHSLCEQPSLAHLISLAPSLMIHSEGQLKLSVVILSPFIFPQV